MKHRFPATHLRRPDWSGVYCKSAARAVRSTGTPGSADCARCRKAAGLGKYNALDAIRSLVTIAGAV
jgi:hypothetical protein